MENSEQWPTGGYTWDAPDHPLIGFVHAGERIINVAELSPEIRKQIAANTKGKIGLRADGENE